MTYFERFFANSELLAGGSYETEFTQAAQGDYSRKLGVISVAFAICKIYGRHPRTNTS